MSSSASHAVEYARYLLKLPWFAEALSYEEWCSATGRANG